jgi:hypothetical protein
MSLGRGSTGADIVGGGSLSVGLAAQGRSVVPAVRQCGVICRVLPDEVRFVDTLVRSTEHSKGVDEKDDADT